VLERDDFPTAALARFGPPGRQWIEAMINAVIDNSLATGELAMDPPTLAVMNELRDFMFARVYLSGEQQRRNDAAVALIRRLIDYHLEHPDEVPDSYRDSDADLTTQVVDYVAGMTDRFAEREHDRLFGA
jgi:dGTPase